MKKYLISVSLVSILVVGCGKGDDVARTVIKQFDPPPVPKKIPIPVSRASDGISNFIKQAGKSRGQQYISQQVSNKQPISRQTLSDVIFDETVSELKKTAQRYVISEVKSLAREEGDALIDEYNSQNNNSAQVTQ